MNSFTSNFQGRLHAASTKNSAKFCPDWVTVFTNFTMSLSIPGTQGYNILPPTTTNVCRLVSVHVILDIITQTA